MVLGLEMQGYQVAEVNSDLYNANILWGTIWTTYVGMSQPSNKSCDGHVSTHPFPVESHWTKHEM